MARTTEEERKKNREILKNYFLKTPTRDMYQNPQEEMILHALGQKPAMEDVVDATTPQQLTGAPIGRQMASVDSSMPMSNADMASSSPGVQAKLATMQPQVPEIDPVEDARQSQRRRLLYANLAEAGGGIGAALAGIKQDTSFFDKLRNQTGSELQQAIDARNAKKEEQKLKDDRSFKERLLNKQLAADKENATLKNQGLTKGQEKLDADYAANHEKYIRSGAVNAEKSIAQLKEVLAEVKEKAGYIDEMIAGRASFMPDAVRSTDRVRLRDNARNTAMAGLKEIFTGTMSDKDVERASAEFFNDKLSYGDNARILEDKIKQLEAQKKNADQIANHFSTYGSLSNYSTNRIKHYDKAQAMSDSQKQQLKQILSDPNNPRYEQAKRIYGQMREQMAKGE